MNAAQLREYVIRPALRQLDPHIPYSEGAVELVLGTAAQESRFEYIAQLGGGPALGLWQMEPATHDDCWANYIAARPQLITTLGRVIAPWGGGAEQMAWNLIYAACMARLQYRRFPEPLPKAEDLDGIAALWKLRWNTMLGAGTVEEFKANYLKHVGGPPK